MSTAASCPCGRPVFNKRHGLCSACYQLARKSGQIDTTIRLPKTIRTPKRPKIDSATLVEAYLRLGRVRAVALEFGVTFQWVQYVLTKKAGFSIRALQERSSGSQSSRKGSLAPYP